MNKSELQWDYNRINEWDEEYKNLLKDNDKNIDNSNNVFTFFAKTLHKVASTILNKEKLHY